MFLLHFCDNKHCCLIILYSLTISFYSANFNAVLCRNSNKHSFSSLYSLKKSTYKIKLARSINNIYLYILINSRCKSRIKTNFPFYFFGIIIHNCISISCLSHTVSGTALKQQSLCQCGFSARSMPC